MKPIILFPFLAACLLGVSLAETKDSKETPAGSPASAEKTTDAEEATGKPAEPPANGNGKTEDTALQEDAESAVAVAIPVNPDPVRVYGWREYVQVEGVEEKLLAKLDTGALTSSIHAEEKELYERDGKKWVRFIVSDPRAKEPKRTRLEAPLVRVALIKEPDAESEKREVVRLNYQLGDRKLRGEFTLNNRSNMLAPVLIGRNCLKDLGWVDPARTHLADQNILR
ncbi:MAG: ATP-dependent zinc protease [Luteolibacter sp.]